MSCKKVSLYGFSRDVSPHDGFIPRFGHYYKKDFVSSGNSAHFLDQEHMIYRTLVKAKNSEQIRTLLTFLGMNTDYWIVESVDDPEYFLGDGPVLFPSILYNNFDAHVTKDVSHRGL